jgi:hypothetical protein
MANGAGGGCCPTFIYLALEIMVSAEAVIEKKVWEKGGKTRLFTQFVSSPTVNAVAVLSISVTPLDVC